MERVGYESKRVYSIANDQFDEEEDSIDSQEDLYPAALGESHLGVMDRFSREEKGRISLLG